jgi:hypothetical protein
MGWATGVQFLAGTGIFLFVTASRPVTGPMQWVLGSFSLWVKQPGHGADHSSLSSAEVKNVFSYTSTHSYMSSWHGAWLSTVYVFMVWYLVKHRDNCTSTWVYM